MAYYDVSKAFDSVWIDGLFYQLHNLGIKGSLWRILYKMCVDFSCCFKIGNISSSWFNMECGIHHGGFLSLMKSQGGHSGTEGGRTFVTYFAEEGVFF